jgi:hypothetical protein
MPEIGYLHCQPPQVKDATMVDRKRETRQWGQDDMERAETNNFSKWSALYIWWRTVKEDAHTIRQIRPSGSYQSIYKMDAQHQRMQI